MIYAKVEIFRNAKNPPCVCARKRLLLGLYFPFSSDNILFEAARLAADGHDNTRALLTFDVWFRPNNDDAKTLAQRF